MERRHTAGHPERGRRGLAWVSVVLVIAALLVASSADDVGAQCALEGTELDLTVQAAPGAVEVTSDARITLDGTRAEAEVRGYLNFSGRVDVAALPIGLQETFDVGDVFHVAPDGATTIRIESARGAMLTARIEADGIALPDALIPCTALTLRNDRDEAGWLAGVHQEAAPADCDDVEQVAERAACFRSHAEGAAFAEERAMGASPDEDGSETLFIPTGDHLTVKRTPSDVAGLRLTVTDAHLARMARVEEQGRWVHVHMALGVRSHVNGWVRRSTIRRIRDDAPSGALGTLGTIAVGGDGVRAQWGTVAVDTAVASHQGGAPWARVGRRETVLVAVHGDWVEILRPPGVRTASSLWVPRARVDFDASIARGLSLVREEREGGVRFVIRSLAPGTNGYHVGLRQGDEIELPNPEWSGASVHRMRRYLERAPAIRIRRNDNVEEIRRPECQERDRRRCLSL